MPGVYGGGERRMPRKLEQANVVIGLPGLSFRDERYFGALPRQDRPRPPCRASTAAASGGCRASSSRP
ncbi:hypothetical protein CTI14_68045, partial [Methylobacterium radiotolerans]